MTSMTPQFNAAWELHQFLTKEKIPYAIIGGIALQYWGEPRFTRDVGITIMATLGQEETILQKIFSVFPPRIPNALDFAIKHRVCLVRSREGSEIDISLGIPGYEEKVVERAVKCDIGQNHMVNVCSAEDLVIHKAIAGRPQDLADIEGIILRQGKKLDVEYIQDWLRKFSALLETEDIIERFRNPWKRLVEENL